MNSVLFFCLVIVLGVIYGSAFQVSRSSKPSSLRMALSDYKEELAKTAREIAAPGKYSCYHNNDIVIIKIIFLFFINMDIIDFASAFNIL